MNRAAGTQGRPPGIAAQIKSALPFVNIDVCEEMHGNLYSLTFEIHGSVPSFSITARTIGKDGSISIDSYHNGISKRGSFMIPHAKLITSIVSTPIVATGIRSVYVFEIER